MEVAMSDWLMKVIKAEAERLIALSTEDDELRADLRSLAEQILAATEGSGIKTGEVSADLPPASAPASTADEDASASEATSETAKTDNKSDNEPLRELTLGRSAPSISDQRAVLVAAPRVKTRHGELAEIEVRCRWKSEAARWAAERLLRIREGNDFPVENPQMDREMIEWADRLTDFFYWVKSSESSEYADLSLLFEVGGCFETLAEALAVVRAMLEKSPGNQKVLERMLPLVAEAQSALRAALKHLGAPDDPDQLDVFEWLTATAARHHVYLKRFMRADDVANPSCWPDLFSRVEALATSGQLSRQHGPRIESLREHANRRQAGEASDDDWQAIIKTVDELVGDGVPPSNREIRELLLPVIDDIPDRDDLPNGFRLILREIDRFLARRPSAIRPSVSHARSPEVKEAARLLGGRSVVLIGGSRRREAQESLRSVLGLSELIWIETKEHQSVDTFEPLIARADVAVVLLAIRWSSHAFGDVRHFCDRYNKPLVRLPGGYSLNQVVAQILSQCSGKLEVFSQNS
jgi:hypothetical protein